MWSSVVFLYNWLGLLLGYLVERNVLLLQWISQFVSSLLPTDNF